MYTKPIILRSLRARFTTRIIALVVLTGIVSVTVAPVSAMIASPAPGSEAVVHHGFSSPSADMFGHLLTDARLRSAVIAPRPFNPEAISTAGYEGVFHQEARCPASRTVTPETGCGNDIPSLLLSAAGKSNAQPLGP